MQTTAVEVRGLYKTFAKGAKALNGVSLEVTKGEMVALIGASGSGKSTLLRHIAGLVEADKNTESTIEIFGNTILKSGKISSDARSIRASIGVIFQQFNLVGRLSVLTNVLIGFLGQMSTLKGTLGLFTKQQKVIAMQALQRVGIAPYALQRGSDLSGGQQQRAAIARTLVQGAEIIIADEPIASLDPSSARKVMDILGNLNREDGTTVIVSLHQVEYALKYCHRTVALRAGKIVYDGPSKALTPAFLGELYGAESEELFLPGLETPAAETGETNGNSQDLDDSPSIKIPAAAAIARSIPTLPKTTHQQGEI